MVDPRLASSRLHADVERLKAQADLSWSRELAVYQRLGLRDDLSILEVGSGPGFITQGLLDTFPTSTVTCVELDPDMADVARTTLADHDRWDIVETSILNTNLVPESFDFALARYVLQHVSDPELALWEIHRLLAPGGTLIVADVDDALGGIVSPSFPSRELASAKLRQLQHTHGGDRAIGRKLWRLLVNTGFSHVDLEAIVFHSDELGLEAFLRQYAPERYRPFLSPEEWQAYTQEYARFVASPEAQILQLLMLASGTKPAEQDGSAVPGPLAGT